MVTGWTAAAVAIAKGEHAGGDAVLLPALPPAFDRDGRVSAGIVVVVDVGIHLRAVDPFPGEGVVGKRIAVVIDPEQLLRGEVSNAAAAHDLWQRCGVAENIRQPEQLALHTELLAEEAFAVDELTDQALAAGNVGVWLHPRAALRDPLAARNRLLDAPVKRRVAILHHLVKVWLALQKAIFRVLVHQRQRCGEGSGAFALGLSQRPQPGSVDVGVAEGDHGRGCRAIDAGQQGLQALAGGPHAGQHLRLGQLEVDQQGEIAQPPVDLGNPQRVGVDMLADFVEGLHIQPELIDFLLPDPKGAVAYLDLGERRFGDGLAAGRDGTGMDHPRAVSRVDLGDNGNAGAWLSLTRQRDFLVLMVHRARELAVKKDETFAT